MIACRKFFEFAMLNCKDDGKIYIYQYVTTLNI